MQEPKIAGKIPELVLLDEGEIKIWCACGHSKVQPFCDGNHKNSNIKPLTFVSDFRQQASLCTCKLTKNPPYCDGAHLSL